MEQAVKASDAEDQTRKAEFDLLVEHLTLTHHGFIDTTGKVAGFLLLALGWFATSKDARSFLASAPNMTILAATAVASVFLLSVAASWVAFQVSTSGLRRLNELAYLPPSAYSARVLGPITFWACVAGNGILASLLVAALLGNAPH